MYWAFLMNLFYIKKTDAKAPVSKVNYKITIFYSK